jgi:hypothetical protein
MPSGAEHITPTSGIHHVTGSDRRFDAFRSRFRAGTDLCLTRRPLHTCQPMLSEFTELGIRVPFIVIVASLMEDVPSRARTARRQAQREVAGSRTFGWRCRSSSKSLPSLAVPGNSARFGQGGREMRIGAVAVLSLCLRRQRSPVKGTARVFQRERYSRSRARPRLPAGCCATVPR